jgi:hypothetical protein
MGPPLRAFPAILADDLVLQVVANLRDDTYSMTMYDSIGSILRHSPLPGPLTLVASIPSRNELVGFVNLTGRPELAVYEYRFGSERNRGW